MRQMCKKHCTKNGGCGAYGHRLTDAQQQRVEDNWKYRTPSPFLMSEIIYSERPAEYAPGGCFYSGPSGRELTDLDGQEEFELQRAMALSLEACAGTSQLAASLDTVNGGASSSGSSLLSPIVIPDSP
jgi:hypothetical protein